MNRHTTLTQDAEKHAAIIRQSLHVFAQEGFRNADVQVIADRAGVGKGTVYRYFGNKQELFWHTTLAVFKRLERHVTAAIEACDSAHARLRAASLAYAEFFQANPDCLEICVQERAMFRGSSPDLHVEHHETLIDKFAAIIKEGVAAGEFRPVDPRETILSLGSSLYGTVIFNCYVIDRLSLVGRAEHVVDNFLEGLRNRGGAQGGAP